MTDAEEQISPAAIAHCELCGVRNFSVGGRTSDGKFHPFYLGDDQAHAKLNPKLGERGWCGRGAPEHFLRVTRVICTAVTIGNEKMNLCPRCARVVTQQARDAEEVAA